MLSDEVIHIIAEQLNLQQQDLKENMKFEADLHADSLDLFQVIIAIEQAFGVEFMQKDEDKIETIHDMVLFIKDNRI